MLLNTTISATDSDIPNYPATIVLPNEVRMRLTAAALRKIAGRMNYRDVIFFTSLLSDEEQQREVAETLYDLDPLQFDKTIERLVAEAETRHASGEISATSLAQSISRLEKVKASR